MGIAKTLFTVITLCTAFVACSLESNKTEINQSHFMGWECSQHEALYDLLELQDGVYIGEIHGQTASAELVYCISQHFLNVGTPVTLSLEIGTDLGDIDKWWQYGMDGSSVATPEMRCVVQRLQATELVAISGHVETQTLDAGGEFNIKNSEKGYADAILRNWSEGSFLLALSGNIHAQRSTFTENGQLVGRAGYYLPHEIITLWTRGAAPGSLNTCPTGGKCGFMEIPAAPGNLTPFSVSRTKRSGYDYEYVVPKLEASANIWVPEQCDR